MQTKTLPSRFASVKVDRHRRAFMHFPAKKDYVGSIPTPGTRVTSV